MIKDKKSADNHRCLNHAVSKVESEAYAVLC